MFRLLFNILLLITVSTISGEWAVAQPEQTAGPNKGKQVQNIEGLQTQKQEIQNQLNEKENELATLLTRHAFEWEQLESVQQGLESATVAFANDNSKTNESKLHNARFKSVLAKRKFNKITGFKNELSQQTTALREKLRSTELAFSQLSTSKIPPEIGKNIVTIPEAKEVKRADPVIAVPLNAEPVITDSVIDSKKVMIKEPTINEKKRLAAEKKAEISRLSALLKQQNESEIQLKLKQKKDKKTVGLVTTQKTTKTTATAGNLTKSQNGTTPASSNSEPAIESSYSTLTSDSKSYPSKKAVVLLHTRAQVRSEELRLQRLQSTKNGSYANYNKMIIVKHTGDGNSLSESSSYTLRTLGHNQYRAKVDLFTGRNQLVIGFNRWSIMIPEKEQDKKFVVILNNSESSNPRLTYFRQTLSSK